MKPIRETFLRAVLAVGVCGVTVGACNCGSDTSTDASSSDGGGGATTTGAGAGNTSGTGASASTSSTSAGTTSAGGSGGGGAGTTSSGQGGETTTTASGTGGVGGEPTGPVPGFCTKPCSTPADCCPPGAPNCPGMTYPNNHECKDGACYAPQCAATEDCTAVNASLDCLSLADTKSCLIACTMDTDCMAPLTCTGTDDNGEKFCVFSGGGCTDDASCAGYGKCVEKVCVCSTDSDCTAAGYTKCAL